MNRLILFLIVFSWCSNCFAQVSVGTIKIGETKYGYQYFITEKQVSPIIIYSEIDSPKCSLVLAEPTCEFLFLIEVAGKRYIFKSGYAVYYDSRLNVLMILDDNWLSLESIERDLSCIDKAINGVFSKLQIIKSIKR